MSSSRVFLTGASGFVGRQILASLLDAGVQVVAATRRVPTDVPKGVFWCSVDLDDAQAVKGFLVKTRPIICIHSAWSVKKPDFWKSGENLRWISSSFDLAEAFLAAGGRRFIGVGTQAEYADQPGTCFESSAVASASTLYGATKDSTRRIVEVLCRDHGVSFAWARLFNVFGRGEEGYKLIPSVIRALAEGEDAPISSGHAVRDFIDVRDAGRAIAKLACSNVEGTVNIGTGTGSSVADVALRIASLMGAKDRLKVGALPDRDGECREIVADIARLVDEVGFSGFRSFDDSARDAIAYWSSRCG